MGRQGLPAHCFSTGPRQTPSEPRQGSRPGWDGAGVAGRLGWAEVSPRPQGRAADKPASVAVKQSCTV